MWTILEVLKDDKIILVDFKNFCAANLKSL